MTAKSDRVDQLIAAWRTELPDVLGPTSELSKRITLLAAALDEATRGELPEFGLTASEFDILVTLRRAGKPYRMKPNELTRALMISSGGTSNVTNHLVAGGLVEREADPDDGRSTWVRLTKQGIAMAEQAVRATSAAHAQILAAVPADAVRTATRALREVSAAVESTRRPAPAARGNRARSVS